MAHLKDTESNMAHFILGVLMQPDLGVLALIAHRVTFKSSIRLHCETLLNVSQINYDYHGNNIQKQLEW